MAIIMEEIEGYIVHGRLLSRGEFESLDELEGFAAQVEDAAPNKTFIFCGTPQEDADYPPYGPCLLGDILHLCEEHEESSTIPSSLWSQERPDEQALWEKLAASGVSFADSEPGWFVCVTGWGWARLSESGSEVSSLLPTADAECGESAERLSPTMLDYLREHDVTMTVSYC